MKEPVILKIEDFVGKRFAKRRRVDVWDEIVTVYVQLKTLVVKDQFGTFTQRPENYEEVK
jgi:hypothetical protein